MTYISNVVDDPQFDAIIVSNIINDITTGKQIWAQGLPSYELHTNTSVPSSGCVYH